MKRFLRTITGGGGSATPGAGRGTTTSTPLARVASSSPAPTPPPSAPTAHVGTPIAPPPVGPVSRAARAAAAGSATPGDSPRTVDAHELRTLIRDPEELRKGAEVYDKGGLGHLARHADRVFCEASGSGAAPYRVTVTLPEDGGVSARCTCMAARSRPICKHGAALIVAWSRAPESFVVGEAPPPGAGEGTSGVKRARPATGKVATGTLQGRGVEQAVALVRELAVAGVGSGSVDRPEQVRALAEQLRANRLRRLSGRVAELADLLSVSSRRRGKLVPLQYADVVGDLLLTARRIEKHLAGDTLEDRQTEELIGRTWRKTDRTKVEDMAITEIAYRTRVTADGFTVRERRLVELGSGTHYGVKQILPAMLVRRTPPLPSRPGIRQSGTGLVYPSYAPQRLDVDEVGHDAPLAPADVERLLLTALGAPAAALAAFQEHRRDVFAPDALPVTVAVEALVGLGDRLAVVGADGSALLVRDDEALLEAIGDRPLRAVLGDLSSDGILAVLEPLAVIAGPEGALTLTPVLGDPVGPAARRPTATDPVDTGRDWLDDARAAGASAAALSLAEVRDELAFALLNGLSSLDGRTADSLVTRLADLGMQRPSELLREVAARPDPADRLDDVVRLHQVLGVAAVRLASTRTVDLGGLVPVPGRPAVRIADPGPVLPPAEVGRRRAAGTIGANEAALHHARHVAGLPIGDLLAIQPWWADASAASGVAAAFAGRAEPPWDLVEAALSTEHGLVAALTAVRVLEAHPSRDAELRLVKLAQVQDPKRPPWLSTWTFAPEQALRPAARDALRRRHGGVTPWGTPAPAVADPELLGALLEQLTTAASRDKRAAAVTELAKTADPSIVPSLRRAWRSDPMPVVRERAARELAGLGDSDMVEPLVTTLADRKRREEDAKSAAYALGVLGDRRGIDALLDALADGWKSQMLGEILPGARRTTLLAVVDRVLAEPALAARRGFVSVLEPMHEEDVLAALDAALKSLGTDAAAAAQGQALLRLSVAKKLQTFVARRLLQLAFDDTPAARALTKAVGKVLDPPKPKAKPKP